MKRLIFVLIGIVVVALLAACGGADDRGESMPEQPAGTGQEVGAGVSAGGSPDETRDPAIGSGEADAPVPPDFRSVSSGGMELSWRVAADALEVKVSAPTTGWVAVGFDPSRMMKDANILIGYVDGSSIVVTDQFGVATTSHRLDEAIGGRTDVTVIGGSESDGVTELHFSIPLDSGDERDRVLTPGSEYTVILAHGENDADDVESYHKARAALTITL